MMKSVPALYLAIAVFFVATLASGNCCAEKRIGFLMFSDETRYLEAANGIKDKLTEAGYPESNTHYIIEKAGANKAKAMELAQKFANEKLDLIIALGTSSALILAKEIKDVPIVFCIVYDPVEIGIAKSWKSSGNNTTGTSTKIPMVKVLDNLKLLRPVKRLAVLYTAGEKNSESVLMDLKNIQAKAGIKIIPVLIGANEDIDRLLPEVLHTVDGVYVTGSNLVNSRITTIVDMATKAGVVTVSHLEDLIEKGVLMGVCANPYTVGRLAGEKAVKILRGAKPSSLSIEVPAKFEVVLNMKTAREGQFPIPSKFMKTVTRKIE
ncbi:MAG TPA: ABC transporter substrate-binding protein [Nitrospirota bacterium]|nr:ABC transporter substrate-binding protein [Nitrospirota bacterium]